MGDGGEEVSGYEEAKGEEGRQGAHKKSTRGKRRKGAYSSLDRSRDGPDRTLGVHCLDTLHDDNRFLLCAGHDRCASIWGVRAGWCMTSLRHSAPVTAILFHVTRSGGQTPRNGGGSGRGGEGALGRRGKAARGELRRPSLTETTRLITGAADGTVRVFNTQGGHLLYDLRAHCGPVHSLQVLEDMFPRGKRQGTLGLDTTLLTAGGDGTTRVWSLARRRSLAVRGGHE